MVRDQRRLAAIISADVAGYSRLMGRDDNGTLGTLKGHRSELIDPKIAEYGGRIVKTTGDGLLLEFLSVVDAVRRAVDVQRGMAERMSACRRISGSTFASASTSGTSSSLSKRYSGRKLTRSLRRLSNASICCPNAWLTARLASTASATSGANANSIDLLGRQPLDRLALHSSPRLLPQAQREPAPYILPSPWFRGRHEAAHELDDE
jgi:hypothetical protein